MSRAEVGQVLSRLQLRKRVEKTAGWKFYIAYSDILGNQFPYSTYRHTRNNSNYISFNEIVYRVSLFSFIIQCRFVLSLFTKAGRERYASNRWITTTLRRRVDAQIACLESFNVHLFFSFLPRGCLESHYVT